MALACVAPLLEFAAPAPAAQRQALSDQVPAAVKQLQPLKRLAGTNRLELVIALPLRNREALTGLLQQQYDPASPYYRQYLTPAEFTERFGPSQQDYEAVTAFAKANGLKVTGTHPNRTLVDVSGTAGDIEKAFQVKLQVYQHPTEARTFYAPDAEPSVELAVPVLAISGLNDFAPPHPAKRGAFIFRKMSADGPKAQAAASGTGPRGYLLGRDFRAAYAPGVMQDGSGQVVGLAQFDGYYTNDILAYQNLAGLPNVPVTNVLVNGFSGRPGAGNAEVSLDLAMVISMAPGLEKVIVYQAAPSSNPYALLNWMANDTNSLGQPAARQLSSSWIWSGYPTAAENQIFQQFAAQGQSFFQATGDDGAYCSACPPASPTE